MFIRWTNNWFGRTREEVPILASPIGEKSRLVLSENLCSPGRGAHWIAPLLVLGSRAERYYRNSNGRQIIIALSVPKRDFAAALIACGWVLASDVPTLPDPLDTLKSMEPGQPLRVVNFRQVIAGEFRSLNDAVSPPQARFAGSNWRVDRILALTIGVEPGTREKEPRPEPASVEHMVGLDRMWDAWLVSPAADLAIVGTLKWLERDLDAYLAKEGDGLAPSSIRSLLRPKTSKSATWFARLFPSAGLGDLLPLPKDLNAVVLDGNGAIKYLGEIEAPVVICVFDRSVADDTAAELLIQLRNTRGEPISLGAALGWSPPQGVEALAFTVAL